MRLKSAISILFLATTLNAQTVVIDGSEINYTIPKMSLIGALQRDGFIPPGFVPREGGLRLAHFTIDAIVAQYPYTAACMLDQFDRKGVIAAYDKRIQRWWDGKDPQLIADKTACLPAWEICWPGELPNCPE